MGRWRPHPVVRAAEAAPRPVLRPGVGADSAGRSSPGRLSDMAGSLVPGGCRRCLQSLRLRSAYPRDGAVEPSHARPAPSYARLMTSAPPYAGSRCAALRAPLMVAGATLAATTYARRGRPERGRPLPDLPVPGAHGFYCPVCGSLRSGPRSGAR